MRPSTFARAGLLVALVSVTAALPACSSSSSSGSSGKSAETTAAKVATERAEANDRLDKAASLVTDLGDKISGSVAAKTRCVVAIPGMVKAGVVVGGQSGKGFASCRTAQGWSAPAPVTIGGGTLGAQLGASSTDLLALVTTEKAEKALYSGNFNVGVDASATAGPVGAGRGAATDVTSDADVLSYSRSKGLFAGANIDGTTIKVDDDATNALYGSVQQFNTLLTGRVAVPSDPSAQRFMSAVSTTFKLKPVSSL